MKILQANRYPIEVTFTETDIWVKFNDGTAIGNPLDWFPWLQSASPEEKASYKLYESAVFWESLEDGVDIEGMLRGIKPKYPQKLEA